MEQIITQIVKVDRMRRYELYLDGEPRLTVHEDVLVRYGLHKGMKIEEEEWRELLLAEEASRVRQAALRFLSYRPRTRKEMEEHLLAKEFAARSIQDIVEELQSSGYLDDASYARAWVQERKRKGLGNFRVEQELKRKGVSEEFISAALAEIDSVAERQLAMEMARRRYLRMQSEPWEKVKRKLANYLLGRGFTWELIGSILRELQDDRGEN